MAGVDSIPVVIEAEINGATRPRARRHLHVGLEEHFDPECKPTNQELVREAATLVADVGRPIATDAVRTLGLPTAG